MTATATSDRSMRMAAPQKSAAASAASIGRAVSARDRRTAARRGLRAGLLLLALLAAQASAQPARQVQAREPLPPDREAITVYGRYQPSLESLAPPGVEVGDLNMVDGRLLIQVHADGERARKAFVRALEGSGWYRRARWEPVDGGLRQGEHVLSVQPQLQRP